MNRRLVQSCFTLAISLSNAIAWAQDDADRPTSGWVGGPYKVIAEDFTGDGLVDLVLGYVPTPLVTLERGDGNGNFSRTSLFDPTWDEKVRMAAVHNMDAKDVDGDGLLDLVIGIGGRAERGNKDSFSGRVVLMRNAGQGRFEQMLEFPSESQAKGVRLVDLDKDG